MSSLTLESGSKCFSGVQRIYSHHSEELKCQMNFGVYLPEEALLNSAKKFPVLFFLSGLTCTEANFVQKGGFQKYAARHSMIVVNPDTSPRGCNIEGEADSWDFGVGAGFYVNATEQKWTTNFRMYSYVCSELPKLVCSNFNADINKIGISGHSMGGHGALTCALKNPDVFKSVSAFAPISNPVECPWGQKALSGYLGADRSKWLQYDSCHLMKDYKGPVLDILIDQGDADQFLKDKQLLTENLSSACANNKNIRLNIRMQKEYDHSYFFIATFIGEHFDHHAKILKA